MRIVAAMDSFKGSLSAKDASNVFAKGWRRARPEDEVFPLPVADGGEGTLDALMHAWDGRLLEAEVTGPLGEPVTARFGLSRDGRRAVVEMAEASGLTLMQPSVRDATRTTTRGTGELLRAALDEGVDQVYVAVGGSGTNDGGAGMAAALGVRFLDGDGVELSPGGTALARLAEVDATGLDARLWDVKIVVAADVDNPLTGPEGASAVFGPQKGAGPEEVAALDGALTHYADVVEGRTGRRRGFLAGAEDGARDRAGVGAAGGLAYALAVFCGAEVASGADLVLDAVGIDEWIAKADLVVTGEGRLDGQSVHGKAPVAVARRARRQGRPVVAVAAALGPGWERLYDAGVDACLSIAVGPMDEGTSIAQAGPLLEGCGERVARLVGTGIALARGKAQ